MLSRQRTVDAATVTLGIASASVAIACCAGLPIVAALLAGPALGAILGLGFGAVALGALAWTVTQIFTGELHRRGCDKTSEQR